VEGVLTAERIWQYVVNTGSAEPFTPRLEEYLTQNEAFMAEQIAAANGTDPFWHHVDVVWRQQRGLYDGYSSVAGPAQQLPFRAIYAINLVGDLFDLDMVYGSAAEGANAADEEPPLRRGSAPALAAAARRAAAAGLPPSPGPRIRGDVARKPGHCSGLVKLTPGNTDLLTSHATWASTTTMTRIWKVYDMPLRTSGQPGAPAAPARSMAMSSYPASLYSSDDFYTMLPTQLVVQETTLDNNNMSLYHQFVQPRTVLEWLRNLVANRLATSAPSWVELFANCSGDAGWACNSGTYNNEFMVVDYSLFAAGAPLAADTVWVLDQMPGHIQATDFSAQLQEQRYFASYNVPYFPAIFNVSNQGALVKRYGPWFSWGNTSRALMFARGQAGVTDATSLRALMRLCDFQTDPLARQGCGTNPPFSGVNAIAARSDLNPPDGVYPIADLGWSDNDAIDVKFTTAQLMQAADGSMGASAESSPSHDSEPVFVWSTSSVANETHIGLPDAWAFPLQTFTWAPPPAGVPTVAVAGVGAAAEGGRGR
jgi:hypothetical protein